MKPENNSLFVLKHIHSRTSTARELGNPWMWDKILSWRQRKAVCPSVQTRRAGEGRRCKGGDENPKNVSCISIGEKQTSLNRYIIQIPLSCRSLET